MDDKELKARRKTVGADNAALEALAAVHGSLLRALEAIPNSVYTAFTLPDDMRRLDTYCREVNMMLNDAETKQRRNEEILRVASERSQS